MCRMIVNSGIGNDSSATATVVVCLTDCLYISSLHFYCHDVCIVAIKMLYIQCNTMGTIDTQNIDDVNDDGE